ncbi:MAG: oxygen-independent coproporphyrinogen III oxidase [Maritimibacter sp.]
MQTLTQLRKLGLFDARVPRYTSYPTAPHLKNGVGGEEISNWLGDIPAGSSVSLYVHVPFCRRLCWFCACRTQGTATAEPVAAYVETLKQEIELVKARLPEGVTLEHLHWGGGTPTLLEPAMITDLAGAIFDMAPLAPGAQFSVEIDPTEVDGPRLDALAAAGLNRASIGVQDFDPMIQEVIGRPQSYEITREAVDGLRERGIRSLNVDLLYGLPHQTEARMTDSVEKVISLGPDRIALFGYAHVPWMSKRQQLIPTEALPSPDERFALYNLAHDLFIGDGFEAIGIDHFAKPEDGLAKAWKAGTMHRNFQGYTEDKSTALIGLGASSIADDDLLRGRIIEKLLCDFRVDLGAVADEQGVEPDQVLATLDGLEETLPGTTEMDGNVLIIKEFAIPLARMIAKHFDAYEMSATGHSQAV